MKRQLSALGRYDELEKHLNSEEYKDDCAPDWRYTKALLSFIKTGDSPRSRGEFKVAVKRNPYVAEYMAGKKSIQQPLPDTITVGGEDEAMCYAANFLPAWKKVSGAIAWFKEQAGIKDYSNVGRNGLCPCESGKKFKKCCGR